MGANVCEIKSWESAEFEVSGFNCFSRGVRPQSERRCPFCNSVIYSRRHKLCGSCGETLPAECLFSAEEAESIAALLTEERDRHRKWLHRFTESPTPSAGLLS
jgi:hypothetical protein